MQYRTRARDVEVSEIGVQYDIFEVDFGTRSERPSFSSQSSAFDGFEVLRSGILLTFSVLGNLPDPLPGYTGREVGCQIILLWVAPRQQGNGLFSGKSKDVIPAMKRQFVRPLLVLLNFVQSVERGNSLDLNTLEKRRQSSTSHKFNCNRDGEDDDE